MGTEGRFATLAHRTKESSFDQFVSKESGFVQDRALYVWLQRSATDVETLRYCHATTAQDQDHTSEATAPIVGETWFVAVKTQLVDL